MMDDNVDYLLQDDQCSDSPTLGHSHMDKNVYLLEADQSSNSPSSYKLNAQKKSLKRRLTFLRLFCAFLHISFFLLHVVVFYICKNKLENRITFPLGDSSSRASTGMSVLLLSFGTIYTTLMVYTMQQLVIGHQLGNSLTLTSLHDTANAWTGLGSALMTMYGQFRIPAAVGPTLLITIYLGCIAVLHISTGALFSLETFNTTITTDVPTMGLLNYPTFALPRTDSISLLTMINDFRDQSTFVGLANGTVYDIPSDNVSTGTLEVNATYFNVSCGFVGPGPNTPGPTMRVMHTYDLTLTVPVDSNYPLLLVVASTGLQFMDSVGNYPPIQNLTNYTTFTLPVYGGDDGGESWVITSPTVIVPQFPIQALGCALKQDNVSVTIDSQTGLIHLDGRVPLKSHSVLQSYDIIFNNTGLPQTPIENGYSLAVEGAPAGEWDASYSSFAPIPQGNSNPDFTPGGNNRVLTPEQYIMESLNITPPFAQLETGRVSNLTRMIYIHDLENAISNAFATMYWADANLFTLEDNLYRINHTSTGQKLFQASRVSSSIYPIVAGMVASGILMVIAAPHFLLPNRIDTSVASLGMLQVLWLVNQHPELADAVADVKFPSNDNLRRAAMIDSGIPVPV